MMEELKPGNLQIKKEMVETRRQHFLVASLYLPGRDIKSTLS
ncbi:hypothetical protein TIFTF001_001188 [Ficus carica]|uniref:Uncharacterized protein n=1 Tax=Ficus carica TaxID=3494 RepID=A0AA87YYS6_FICCA|nr:hypothetical protein TIFTF001_001188 [Ficus carica]